MKFRLFLALVAFLSGCASSPNMNNDPRSGGLLGGVSGLMQGDYDARVKQRQNSVDRLNQTKALLSQETSEIEQQKLSKSSDLNIIRNQVDALDKDIGVLSVKIAATNKTSKANELKKQRLMAKKNVLQKHLWEIQDAMDKQQLTVKDAEVKRERLQDEYKKLAKLMSNL